MDPSPGARAGKGLKVGVAALEDSSARPEQGPVATPTAIGVVSTIEPLQYQEACDYRLS
jgi:hypothetical protein